MRVLFVTHSFPRYEGDGAGEFILRLATALVAAGCVVKVLAPAGTGLNATDSMRGVDVERFRYAPRAWETLAYTGTMAEQVAGSATAKLALAGLVAAGSAAVARAVDAFKPDVVHAHWWFPGGISAAGGSGACPLVVTLHGSDVRLASRSRFAPAAFRLMASRTAAVTAVSSWLATVAAAFAPRLEIAVAPMPADVSTFHPGNWPRQSSLLFVGRLNAQKGVADLLRALALIRSDVSLDIVGDGPDRATLESLARTLGLADRVHWHGQLRQSALGPLYAASYAVVIPSHEEGLGLVAAEALLSETPVVAYRSGGLIDLVEDGATGRLVAEGDVDELANAVNRLLAAPDQAAAMGAVGRKRMLARFAPATVAASYLKVYERAIVR